MQLLNGDCMELLKTIPDSSVDLVVTDPPYEIATTGGGLAVNGQVKQWKEHDLDSMKDGFSPVVLDELCRVMKKVNCYFFCSQRQIMPLVQYFTKKKCNWNLLCWHKNNPVPACGNKYLSDTEFILFFREKGVKIFGSYDTKRTYYVTATNQKEKKLYDHPTVKPVEILENLILNSTAGVGCTVLDPFMGTGSTGVAAKKLGRDFIGIELDSKHFNTATRRIEAL